MKKIDMGWKIDNTYDKLPQVFYSHMNPNPVTWPELIIINEALAKSLGLNIEGLRTKEAIDILGGNKAIEGSRPLAQAYGGHQFGHFTMLGDGRAMLLGEQITPCGERFDIQLKGSGITKYSRGGDGRAGLGPMLREYIISEAMYNLGIPTSRSLAVLRTGEKIIRETRLDGAILTRISKSNIRVGTFEYASNWGSLEDLKSLADYTIKRHFPKILVIKEDENPYISLLKVVIKLQARLISKWQLVGFIHGVMNTDNVSIGGETFDYGPCAFMDSYDPKTVFSSIDRHGRYAYGNQPNIGKWNLARFAESLLPLIHKDEEESIKIATGLVDRFDNIYENYWLNGMRSKLGIFNEEAEDKVLIEELLGLMEKYKEDYTNTFISLSYDDFGESGLIEKEDFKTWYNKWEDRLNRQEESKDLSIELMRKSNPAAIPRNYQVEKALKAAVEDNNFQALKDLLKALSDPYNYSEIPKEYMEPPEDTSVAYKTYCGT